MTIPWLAQHSIITRWIAGLRTASLLGLCPPNKLGVFTTDTVGHLKFPARKKTLEYNIVSTSLFFSSDCIYIWVLKLKNFLAPFFLWIFSMSYLIYLIFKRFTFYFTIHIFLATIIPVKNKISSMMILFFYPSPFLFLTWKRMSKVLPSLRVVQLAEPVL